MPSRNPTVGLTKALKQRFSNGWVKTRSGVGDRDAVGLPLPHNFKYAPYATGFGKFYRITYEVVEDLRDPAGIPHDLRREAIRH